MSNEILEVKSVEDKKRKTYAILMETNGDEYESWYYFIRYEGNENSLEHLKNELDRVGDWYIIDGYSTFDLELDRRVSEQTAKEMIEVDLNHTFFHRKFDGKLDKITFGFKDRHKNKRRIKMVYDILGYGNIDKYIDEEDVPDDYEEETSFESDSEEEKSYSESSSDSETESSSSDSEDDSKLNSKKKKGKIPPMLKKSNLPGFAKGKQHRRKK